MSNNSKVFLNDREVTMKRNGSIDLLRAIGLLLVILAHIQPPHVLFEIRSFDVVLLVFLSGMSFSLSSKVITDKKAYVSYLLRRFKKLIIPTWVVLVVFFVLFNILKYIFSFDSIIFTKSDYIYSFSLVSGVGIVWVMRVYYSMSIIAPFLKKDHFDSKRFLLLLPLFLLAYEIITRILEFYDYNIIVKLVEAIFIYTLGYGYCFFVGMQYGVFNRKEKIVFLLINALAFVITGFISEFGDISAKKYPPQVYYLTYGMIVTIILNELFHRIRIKSERISNNSIIVFLSKNSLMIYLFHLFPLKAVEYNIVQIRWGGWVFKYLFVLLTSIVMTVVYNYLLYKVGRKKNVL